MNNYFKDETFTSTTDNTIFKVGVEFDNCTFSGINFSEINLHSVIFNDCIFNSCNLTLTGISKTAFRKVIFSECKLMGLKFEQCNPLGLEFTFERSMLAGCSFYKLKIPKTHFKDSVLRDVDFSEADLHHSVFTRSQLPNTRFEQCNLTACDFSTSEGYSINPSVNTLRKAKFSLPGAAGLLESFGIELV